MKFKEFENITDEEINKMFDDILEEEQLLAYGSCICCCGRTYDGWSFTSRQNPNGSCRSGCTCKTGAC